MLTKRDYIQELADSLLPKHLSIVDVSQRDYWLAGGLCMAAEILRAKAIRYQKLQMHNDAALYYSLVEEMIHAQPSAVYARQKLTFWQKFKRRFK